MKKIVSIMITVAIAATIALSLVACTGNGEEEFSHNIIVEDPTEASTEGGSDDELDINETAKQPDGSSAETENWELGGIPLN